MANIHIDGLDEASHLTVFGDRVIIAGAGGCKRIVSGTLVSALAQTVTAAVDGDGFAESDATADVYAVTAIRNGARSTVVISYVDGGRYVDPVSVTVPSPKLMNLIAALNG